MSQALVDAAAKLRRAGRYAEAAIAYKQLLTLRPDLGESWYNLAWVQRQIGQLDEALESYRQALNAGISGAEEVHLNRAAILSLQPGCEDAAFPELQRALAINANYVPALLNLGNFEEDRGRREKARAHYARALAIEPDNILALARLAGVSQSPDARDAVISQLRVALDRPDASAADRADLGFALGRLLDERGEYDLAFAAYRAANQASFASLGPGAARYNPRAHEQLVDRIISIFARPVSHVREGADNAPLFICGMFRSGSSLTEQILASHSGVTPGGELELVPTLIRSLVQPYPDAAAKLDAKGKERLRLAYLEGLGGVADQGKLVTDKRPDNFLHIGLIKTFFPDAKIIYTRRNPLDNILSLYFLHLNPEMAHALDLLDSAHWYQQHQRLMAHWNRLYPGDIFEMDYDRLVGNPRESITALLEFCGLELEDSCLSFHATKRSVKTASVWQVREPLYQRASGRWRNYERHLQGLRAALNA